MSAKHGGQSSSKVLRVPVIAAHWFSNSIIAIFMKYWRRHCVLAPSLVRELFLSLLDITEPSWA
jgi:hypothetical protein